MKKIKKCINIALKDVSCTKPLHALWVRYFVAATAVRWWIKFLYVAVLYTNLFWRQKKNINQNPHRLLKKKGANDWFQWWPETLKGSERWCGGLAFLYIWLDTLNSELFGGCWDIHWVTYSAALVLAVLSAENENRQLEDFSLANFGRLPERLPLSVRTKSINENFVNWKWRPLLFVLSWFNAFFHLKS